MVANYSIREDNVLLDEGNFPMWATDFFPEETMDGGYHAHILDFDVLRLGKKVIENNPNAGSFEFGVVVVTEVGKERGNNLELRDVKKQTDETNQKEAFYYIKFLIDIWYQDEGQMEWKIKALAGAL
ncbi:MAG: hypothetical protein IJX16_07015 [Clostridia bacterium]|nr:hypothetical protein [Clostridia bacterium]